MPFTNRLSLIPAAVFGLLIALHVQSESPEATADDSNKLPLESRRNITFETDEGTWLSLDVAPQSPSIVFELLGDIYTLSATGGNAKPVITGTAFDSQPVFSPDGSKLAFISDRSGSENVWIANADGSNPQQISQDNGDTRFTSPAWSPDGLFIYVSRRTSEFTPNQIWMCHIYGGKGLPLAADKDGAKQSELGAAPSPDGRFVYFATQEPGASKASPYWNIVRRDLQTGLLEIVIKSHNGSVRPKISPDGQLMAYATRHQDSSALRIRNLETGEDHLLVYPVTRDLQDSRGSRDLFPGYAFTADGKTIVFNSNGKIQKVDVSNGATQTIPFTAQVDLAIGPNLKLAQTDAQGPVQARLLQTLRLSPDGKTIAFTAFGKLYSMPASGGKAQRLTTTPLGPGEASEHQAAWSPDGRYLTYVTWAPEGGHIWKIAAGGGKPKRLTPHPAFFRNPAFTPDGKSIVALRASAYDRIQTHRDDRNLPTVQEVVQVSVRGGTPSVIARLSNTAAPVNGLVNDWGRLHFTNIRDNVHVYTPGGLMSVPLFGGVPVKLVQVTVPDRTSPETRSPVTDVRLSPDGKWLLVLDNAQLYLLAAVRTGNEALSIDLLNPSVAHKKLTDIGADYFAWADGGRTITWSVGSTFYTLPMADIDFSTSDQQESDSDNNSDRVFLEDTVAHRKINVELPRDVSGGTIVLRGATAVTMNGDQIIPAADIVVTGNRIAAIGPQGQVDIPSDATIRDVSGKTITPGFINTHSHWNFIRREIIDYGVWLFPANLAYGVTAGLDVQAMNHDMLIYQDLIDAGVLPGPRAYNVTRGVFSSNRFASRKQAVGVLKRYKEHYRTNNFKAYMSGNRLQRQYVIQVAEELGMMPTTEGATNTKLDLTHAMDGFAGNEHTMPALPLYKDVVELFNQSKIGYTPTLVVGAGPYAIEYFYNTRDPLNNAKLNHFTPRQFLEDRLRRWNTGAHKSEYVFPLVAQSVAKIYRAGGQIGAGGHGNLQGLGYHWELEMLASGGLSPAEVMRIATIGSAEVIGRHVELGSLEPGKYADLIVFDKNPMENIRNTQSIEYVMKNGRLYEDENLNQVWPVQ